MPNPDEHLHEIGLLTSLDEPSLDTLTRVASEMLSAPVSLVSIVMPDENRQFFKSMNGLPEPWASRRQTPLSHSFCQHVRASNRPLVVTDARADERVCDNEAVADLGVVAYAGFPVHAPNGNAIGAFCVTDTREREWKVDELRLIEDFAAVADDQIKLLAAVRDQKLALDAEKEAAAAKSRLLATVSHELRTPLGGILGITELLLEDITDASQREMLSTIRTSGRTLLNTLNDLLDSAKINSGKLRLENENFSLRDILSHTVGLHRSTADAGNNTLRLDLANDLPDVINCDRYRLQQILDNLLSNALKFTHEGEVRLTVSTVAESPGMMSFQVSDTGIGMTTEHLSRLFIPFEQADASTSRRYGGTGLGTSIAARLTELLGGTISVESEVGYGSTFTVNLPLSPPASGPAIVPPGENIVADTRLDGLRLLVADDNKTNRTILRAFLMRAGADVILVESGRSAVSSAKEENFDAILLDILMPEMDGTEALGEILAFYRQGERRPPPALAITASALPEDRARYINCGFAACLSKPIDRQALLSAILHHINLCRID